MKEGIKDITGTKAGFDPTTGGWLSSTAMHGYGGFDVVTEQPAPMVTLADAIREERERALAEYVADTHRAGIGEVNSDKPGSGARYNAGKMPIELVPIGVIWWYESQQFEGVPTDAMSEALDVLKALGEWQVGGCNAGYIIGQMDDPWMACTAVFDYGRKKYAEWNWAKGMPWMVPAACAVRHCLAILRGEENDPESGLPHRGHVACNLVMLAQFELSYPAGDNRPKVLQSNNMAPE